MKNSKQRAVFISHASKNFRLADELRSLLEARGLDCWIAPRDIPPGADYGEQIDIAVKNCNALVLVLTKEANQSPAVAKELAIAFACQRVIIPVRLNPVEPASSLNFYISNVQWVDAIQTPLRRRVDVLVNIVNAAINGEVINPPLAESKSLLGNLERNLEGLIRHKMLTLFVALGLLTAIGIATFISASGALSHLENENTKIQSDPATFGLVTLNLIDENLGECKIKELNLLAAIYVNLRDPQKANLELHSQTLSLESEVSLVDLSQMRKFTAADVQRISICVPKDISLITFCMSAEHPALKGRYVAKWTYRIQQKKGETMIVRELEPKMYLLNNTQCEFNQI
jgi:hypothetical protein